MKCGSLLRPNIHLRHDMDWIEDKAISQMKKLDAWVEKNKGRSMTVIEVGAGPVQPLARDFGQQFLLNDKYRCATVRINPIRERLGQYDDERNAFAKFQKEERADRRVDYLTEKVVKTSPIKLPNFYSKDTPTLPEDQ